MAGRYYNNPQLGQGFESIASAFAPPTAQEVAAYANAAAVRQKADQLAWLFNNSSDPTASNRSSLIGVQNYGQTPAGFAATDATNRYGIDQSNARALEQTRMQEEAALTRALLAPVGQGQSRFLPPAVARSAGLPDTQIGVVSAQPGEQLTLPNGQTISGAPKPMTQDQVLGTNTQRLINSGAVTDQQLADMLLGRETPVQALGPDGKPVYMSPGAAVRTGARPAPKPEATTETARLIAERDALPPGDPNRLAYDQRIAALGRGQQQSAYDKATDEGLAKLNETIYANAAGAVTDQNTLQVLQQAVEDPTATQGALGGATLQLRKLLNAFGVPAGDTSPAETINALGNQLALRLRDPSNGAGMPGSLSDSDRQFLLSMSVSLGNSPEANRKLVQFYLATQMKNIGLEQLRQDYVRQNGRLDENFRAQASNFQRQFYDRSAQAGMGQPGAPGGGPPAPPAPPQPPAPPAPAQTPVRVQSPDEAWRLPPGTPIVLPDGSTGVVPAGGR